MRQQPKTKYSSWNKSRSRTINFDTPTPRVYVPPPEPEYPYHDRSVRVTRCGRICVGRRKINLSSVFAGQTIGIREVDDQIWLVSFLEYDLGYFDKEC